MSVGLSIVQEEEREARARHAHMQRAHMQRMQQAAARKRAEDRKAERRAAVRAARQRLEETRRRASAACREYSKALTAYAGCSDRREAELGAALDKAYNVAVGAVHTHRRAEAELLELR